VTEGRSYLRTTTADSTAGKVSDKTKDQTDMMKLMTDMQKRLSDLQRDVNQLKNEKFRPRKFDNTPRFNYGRGQAYGQNYGRGLGYRPHFGRGQDNRQNGYRVNPQKENSQTDKKSRSEVTTNQSSIPGSIGVSSAAQEADIHQVKCKLLVDTGATVSIVSNDIYQKIPDVARPTLTSTKDMVVQALVAQIIVDGIIGLDCLRSNAG
jgi:TolA-binding protein